MSVALATAGGGLGPAVIEHLDAQLVSARRLLDIVLRQGAAIRRQDVEAVMACMAELQTEMDLRGRLEGRRAELLNHAGGQLGVPGHAITLDAMTSLMGDGEAGPARERSAELRGLLAEISREHTVNRALMRQELGFLDHLVRLLSGGTDLGYRPPAGDRDGLRVPSAPATVHRVLNVEA